MTNEAHDPDEGVVLTQHVRNFLDAITILGEYHHSGATGQYLSRGRSASCRPVYGVLHPPEVLQNYLLQFVELGVAIKETRPGISFGTFRQQQCLVAGDGEQGASHGNIRRKGVPITELFFKVFDDAVKDRALYEFPLCTRHVGCRDEGVLEELVEGTHAV